MKIPHWLSVTVSFVLVGFLVALFFIPKYSPFTAKKENTPSFTHALSIGTVDMQVAFSTTSAEQELGLSDSAPLSDSDGMLFIFPSPSALAFWMKDMNYPLDMIWIGADKQVVDISKNLAPDTYPEIFSPKVPAQYVLEVRAGFADAHGIAVGTQVSF